VCADSLERVTTICVPDEQAREIVGSLDGIDVLVWNGKGSAPDLVSAVDMFVPGYSTEPDPAAAFEQMPALSVVQLLSAGVEPWLGLLPPGVVLCNGRGVHGGSTAELAVAGILSALRELPKFHVAQLSHRWERTSTDGLDGKRVLVVGAGDIGARIAASLTPLGAEVTLVARRAREGVHATGELPALLPVHQVVVIAVPHTPDTERMVDVAFLAAMPAGALLVNVARGSLVDTEALLAELRSQRLSAFLDVTDPEPLPPDHPLWDAPNCVLTPHVGGGTRGWQRRAYRLVREQAMRLHNGDRLQNVVGEAY
jgi:phosphoglycerate dehydrogenase-like enzyme